MNDLTPHAKTRAEAGSPLGWLRTEIDRLFEDFGPPRAVFPFAQPVPALEMRADEHEYRLTAELPGLKDTDVEISLADGVLSLRGDKRGESERKEDGYLMRERRYGSFERRIAVPDDVDPDKVRADFQDGVLTITLPKDAHAASRMRKIAINAKG